MPFYIQKVYKYTKLKYIYKKNGVENRGVVERVVENRGIVGKCG
jgi:hypothetical protein